MTEWDAKWPDQRRASRVSSMTASSDLRIALRRA